MRVRWSWFGADVPAVRALLVLGLGLVAVPAFAATIVDRNVRHEIRPDGAIVEQTRMRVRLETRADLDEWARYEIYLDEHRELEDVEARVTPPGDGSPIVLKKKHQDLVESSAGGLHSSARFHVLDFPPEDLVEGAVLEISYRVRVAPYFPGGVIPLFVGRDPVAALRLEVVGAPEGLRWHLSGADVDVRVAETSTGIELVGEGLDTPEDPELAPADSLEPVLRYAWGPATSWDDVGRWYRDLRSTLPATSEPVRAMARRLIDGVDDPRDRLERLLSHTGKSVRYVAVQVGIGGFRPSPPQETLERGWGDCKDKSTLLVEMLEEAGLRAHPALILSAVDERIDPEFPSPFVFNHMIVAVETDGLSLEPTDPVSGGYLFVDPTHDRGTSRWLHGAVQNQHALVVTEGGATLVPTPSLFASNVRDLTVDVRLDADGTARGTAKIDLGGEWGSLVQELLATEEENRLEEWARSIFSRLLPGSETTGATWSVEDGGVPRGTLEAGVAVPRLIPMTGERLAFQLPGLSGTPSTSILDEREVPVVLDAGVLREHWTVTLPREGCTSDTDDVDVETAAGTYRQTVAVDGARLSVQRTLQMAERWIEPDRFDALKELSLAETRSKKRRLRLVCP